jgi:hypothetical protein
MPLFKRPDVYIEEAIPWETRRKIELRARIQVLDRSLADLEADMREFRAEHCAFDGRQLIFKAAEFGSTDFLTRQWKSYCIRMDEIRRERDAVLGELASLQVV